MRLCILHKPGNLDNMLNCPMLTAAMTYTHSYAHPHECAIAYLNGLLESCLAHVAAARWLGRAREGQVDLRRLQPRHALRPQPLLQLRHLQPTTSFTINIAMTDVSFAATKRVACVQIASQELRVHGYRSQSCIN